jgi:hypothetical protein
MPHACATLTQPQTEAVEATSQFEQSREEREEEWRRSLRSLQELICELLMQNQQLRMSLLESATHDKSLQASQWKL